MSKVSTERLGCGRRKCRGGFQAECPSKTYVGVQNDDLPIGAKALDLCQTITKAETP